MNIPDRWICATGNRKLVVDCACILTAYEVLQFAARELKVEPVSVQMAPSIRDDVRPDVELRWTGNDYSQGGKPDCRRLQRRASSADEWTDV